MPHPVYANLIPVNILGQVLHKDGVTSIPAVIYSQVKPDVEFVMSSYTKLSHEHGAITSFNIVGHHMQVQPLAWFLSDDDIWIVYFNPQGEIVNKFVILSAIDRPPVGESVGEPVTIIAYQRLGVEHIPHPDVAMNKVTQFIDNEFDILEYPVSEYVPQSKLRS